uniref:Uncharacterized protein n=1 Tax=Caenorhabditis japonica TaxID=281687 RepID=A0A8R1IJ05_CAEJA
MTPRCARPTKAWMARLESSKKEDQEELKLKRSRLSRDERREVWIRLLAAKKGRRETTVTNNKYPKQYCL